VIKIRIQSLLAFYRFYFANYTEQSVANSGSLSTKV